MPDIAHLIQQGSTNLWLFIPGAILLGALHGLEPGHSKTMMAAFIVAIQGTVKQAVLLGLSATLSHTAIVWLVALVGLHFGGSMDAEASEPYFQIVSAALMLLIAGWMVWRTWRCQHPSAHTHTHDHHHHSHDHHHHHDHSQAEHDHDHRHDHEHHHHSHSATCAHHHHDEDEDDHTTPVPHYHPPEAAVMALAIETHDPHALAHAEDIRRRFANRAVTTPQIILFGLTGGLIPCPASITVLLLCLQLKKVALGALLVVCFSIGLAVTMVSAGVIAALGMRHVTKRWSGFSHWAARAPYFSGVVIAAIALYIGASGVAAL